MNKSEKNKIKKGMKKTIKRLAVAHVKKGVKWHGANLHAVLALCICCFIDALGKYIYGDDADKCKFKRFIENYMPDFFKALIEKAINEKQKEKEFYLELFYSYVRCGLAHEYFPKQKQNARAEIKPRNCNKIVSGAKNELIICLPELKKEFLKSLDRALDDIL